MRLGGPRTRNHAALAALSVAAALLGLAGSASAARSVEELLRAGDYAGAVPLLRQQVERRPTDAALRRGLGAALLEAGDAGAAASALIEARRLDPRNAETLFLLGRSAEATGRAELALDAYRGYLSRGGPGRTVVVARIRALSIENMRGALRQALASERSLRADTLARNTIAVPEFSMAGAADSLAPLRRGLALVMTTDLSQVPELRVLERERLNVLFDEIALSHHAVRAPDVPASQPSTVVDEASAPRIGALVGARRFAQGGLVTLDAARLQLDAVVLDAATSTLRTTGPPVKGRLQDVLGLEKTLVFQVIDTLGIRLSPATRHAIGTPPTKSYGAFIEFCHALDLEERGQIEAAKSAYRRALKLDPKFALARARNDVLSVTPAQQAALDHDISRKATRPEAADTRLLSSAGQLGLRLGPLPHDPAPSEPGRAAAVEVTTTVRLP